MMEFFGWASFVLFLAMQFPQMYTFIKTRSITGVSVYTWVIYALALTMSGFYLLSLEEPAWPVIYNQFISAGLSIINVFLYIYIKKQNDKAKK